MNPGIVLLIIFLIIIIITFVGIFIYVLIQDRNKNTVPTVSCKSQTNVGDLLPLTNADVCYSQSSDGSWQPNGQYYIGEISNGQYDYVVAPYGTTPLNVCVSFCTSFTPPQNNSTSGNCSGTSCGTCIGPEYNSQSAQNNFNNCFNQLSSTTCIPPIPLAINNENILYYPFTPTKCACLDATGQNPCLA